MLKPITAQNTLPLLGVIPFIAGSGGLFIDNSIHIIHVALSSYAIMIVSFMAGIHWGQHLSISHSFSQKLALSSNGVALIAWIGFVALPVHIFYLLAAFLLVIILIVDLLYKLELGLNETYKKTRIFVTTIAVLSLILSFGIGVTHG